MTRSAAQTISPTVAATAIAVGVLANTGMKLALTVVLGSPRFRTIAGGALMLMLLLLGGALIFASVVKALERSGWGDRCQASRLVQAR